MERKAFMAMTRRFSEPRATEQLSHGGAQMAPVPGLRTDFNIAD